MKLAEVQKCLGEEHANVPPPPPTIVIVLVDMFLDFVCMERIMIFCKSVL